MRFAGRLFCFVAFVCASSAGTDLMSVPDVPEESEDRTGRPDVILISLDTVRADHLGCYGYTKRPVSRRLDAFAAAATRYARAQATSPWTLPSHASVFTGLYPFEHGAHTVWVDVPGAKSQPDGKNLDGPLMENVRPLANDFLTLAEALQGLDYQTAAIGANTIYLRPDYGVAQGFDVYDIRLTYAEGVHRRVATWLEQRDDRPFFLFVNYMDAHRPYNPAPQPDLFPEGLPNDSAATLDKLYNIALGSDAAIPADLTELARSQYDRGLANLDAWLGLLFKHLREAGLFDDALIVVFSDHGEYLGEHRLVEHSKDVYQEAMWVPLIVKAPRQTKGRVEPELCSLAHVPGMILDHVTDAEELLPSPDVGDRSVIGENYFTRWKDLLRPWGSRFERTRHVLYRGTFKYIHSTDGHHELYDLAADPVEAKNLIKKRPDLATALAQELIQQLESGPGDLPVEPLRPLTEEEIKRLKALGYL